MKFLKRLALSSLVSVGAGAGALQACEGHGGEGASVDGPTLLRGLDPSRTLAEEVSGHQKKFYLRCKEPGCGYGMTLTPWARYEDALKTAEVHRDMAHGGRPINVLITYQ
ncbi:hypothetical protein [Mesoterricola silvestris]|uniref:Uncharacterized protein n=1 Tax=Mesoterricola silvestris TaxID=2927979 RepID=A0AA48GRC3_9BACT|nr:hypothetical protein [Mesoterricola silvestris]BDU72810.1 hypothetical protein METEAL_19840 [Mesoterricola silvestris]